MRTFENIVPLDRVLTRVPLDLKLERRAQLAPDAFSFALAAPDAARERIDGLDGLNLYVRPLNASTRGGQRYIFHSALLAGALTEAVREALPELDGFAHVNPVFRCNRFEPGDANFHRHLDTPYYDEARKHISRYTMLIYLTGGEGSPALRLGASSVETVEPYTCVIFDQRYEHEGAPFRDGRKVFLRTELVFEFAEERIQHDPEIGSLFSKACYWTGESVFAPELAKTADDYYNRVAAAHWGGLAASDEPEPFVHKEFRGVHFVANGYDFWFGKDLPLTECAAITLLDYFNCTVGGSAFRALCTSEVIEAALISTVVAGQGAVGSFDKATLFPEPEESDGNCCPFHAMHFEPTRLEEIIDDYSHAQTFAKAHIGPAPILMLGEDVVLDPEKFAVRGNQIHVLGSRELAPLNFAACWNWGGSAENYIDTAVSVAAAQFLVPPILFTETDSLYHLQFDFFRNSWMVRHEQTTVPVPRIRTLDDFNPDEVDEEDETPWLEAASKVSADPWWTKDKILDHYAKDFSYLR